MALDRPQLVEMLRKMVLIREFDELAVRLRTAGKIYGAVSATNLTQAAWAPCAFALNDTGPLQTVPAEGNGDWFSLYLPIEEPARFFRLTVE